MKFMKLTVLTAVLAGAMALSACGGKGNDGVATAGDGKAPAASDISSDPQERMRQFAQCMRDQGIDMADPEVVEGEGGGFAVKIGPGESSGEDAEAKIAPKEDMAKFEAAHKACEKYMPEGGPLGGEADPEMEEKMRQFAKCMRENGVEDFPDPEEGGGIKIQAGGPGGEGGINPDDPTFKAAHEKCGEILPNKAGSPATTSKSGAGS